MSESGVRGIDLFKIAGESISGWIPSFKTGEARVLATLIIRSKKEGLACSITLILDAEPDGGIEEPVLLAGW